jgi:hypothetical protein
MPPPGAVRRWDNDNLLDLETRVERINSLRKYLVCLAVFCAAFTPSTAGAQDKTRAAGNDSHWGVRVYVTPAWELTDSIKDKIFDENEDGTWKGSEFGVGVARGSTLGGDWGVSFVRKPFDDDSNIIETSQDCFNQAQTICRPNTTTKQFDGVYLNAVEVHWFRPIVTIKQRAQIGFNIAGGIGSMNGNLIQSRDFSIPTAFGPTGPTAFRSVHEEEVVPAKDELLSIFPLGKIEAAGAVILAPGLKVQVFGGFNFPGMSFRVGGVYLIGAK